MVVWELSYWTGVKVTVIWASPPAGITPGRTTGRASVRKERLQNETFSRTPAWRRVTSCFRHVCWCCPDWATGRVEPEASFALCWDVVDAQAFERTQLSSKRALEKASFIRFVLRAPGSEHVGLPLRGWTEKASWGSTTCTWNSKSMEVLHVRGMLCRMLQTGKKENPFPLSCLTAMHDRKFV